MQTQVRPPRARSSGGRTLMLLGLVLALAAAAIVFYITTSVQGAFSPPSVQVVAATTNLKPGTILSLTDSAAPHMLVTSAFHTEKVDKGSVPPDAFSFSTQDALNAELNNKVIVQQFLQGDILRNNDPRLALTGANGNGSNLTNIDPSKLGPGKVLYVMQLDNVNFGVQPGDMVDIVVPIKDPKTGVTGAEVFNPAPVPVYAVDVPVKDKIILVVDETLAVQLVALQDHGVPMTLVIRSPNDMTPAPPPQPVPTTGG